MSLLLTLLLACFSYLHHDKLVELVYGQQRWIRQEQPALDCQLGRRNRHPPRWLEVIPRFSESYLVSVAHDVHSSATFWQYAEFGHYPGRQDYFIGNDAGLQGYCFSCFLCPCIREKVKRRSPLDLLTAVRPLLARLDVYNVSR